MRRRHARVGALPGEVFRQLADNQLATSGIPLLRRADKLAVLVDGARLCDDDTRASALCRARSSASWLTTSWPPPAFRCCAAPTSSQCSSTALGYATTTRARRRSPGRGLPPAG